MISGTEGIPTDRTTRRSTTGQRPGPAWPALIALAAAALFVFRTGPIGAASDITVCASGCDHASIQAAIDAAAAGDTILLAGETFTETIVIDRNVTIRGTERTVSVIDGGAAHRVIEIPSGVSVTLESLTVRNGRTTGHGGGILNQGTLAASDIAVSGNVAATVASSAGGGIYSNGRLTLQDSMVSGNESQVGGGGIYVSGPTASALIERTSIVENRVRDLTTDFRGGGGLHVATGDATVRDSRIVGNRTDYTGGGLTVRGSGAEVELINSTVDANVSHYGAGIRTQSSAQLTISGSTISNNTASGENGVGGGIRLSAGVTITNSTIFGNSATGSGGGISAEATLNLDSVTISGNAGANGGGIASFSAGTTLVTNSILAGNAASSSGDDCGGSLDGGSGLLIGDQAGCTISAVSAVTVADPLLGSLTDNGGPTLTMLPNPGSPAIDAGTTSLTVDQRGEPRPAGEGPDLGSVEVQPTPSPSPAPSLQTPTGLLAEALGMDTIRLSWTDNSTGEDGYEIQRHDGVDFVRLVLLPPNVTSYMDEGLERNTTYIYRVRSFAGTTQFSDFSDIASATTHDLDPPIFLPIIIVDDAGDTDTRDGVLTLREALLVDTGQLSVGNLDEQECGQLLNTSFDGVCAEATAFGSWAIHFDQQVFPPDNPTTIALGSSLPALSEGGHDIGAINTGVVIDGQTKSFDCFVVTSDGNALRGLQIVGCERGVRIAGGADNVIGGTSSEERNVISGNDVGLLLEGSGSTGNVIVGNYIGTDADGSSAVGNGVGVSLFQAHFNRIGSPEAGGGNLISGNSSDGVRISSSLSNEVAANRIGTDVAGGAVLANGGAGVRIDASVGNTIGGDDPGEGNHISGNAAEGVLIDGNDGVAGANTVQGNLIGLDATGEEPLPNRRAGVSLVQADSNLIGGTSEGARNVISGNADAGIYLRTDSDGNTIQGNLIGTDLTGSSGVPNDRYGVAVSGGEDNLIGGAAAGARNVISGNGLSGVDVRASRTVIQGNRIGTDASGLVAIPNSSDGVTILGGDENVVGGTDPGAGNLISGNDRSGVLIAGDHNSIQGNLIGSDITGRAPLPNGQSGVHVDGGEENVIGGVDPDAGNLISGNDGDGVFISGITNRVEQNLIGTDESGDAALPNRDTGVRIGASSSAAGTVPGADNRILRNTIAYNDEEGVWVESVAGEGNTTRFNSIHGNGGAGLTVHVSSSARADLGKPLTESLAGSLIVDVDLEKEQANTAYLIDIYANAECDPSGFGEGERYVATTLLQTDAEGNATGQVVAGQPVAPGEQLTATATEQLTGTTFEFSVCAEVVEPPVVPADELKIRCVHSPLWPQPGDTVSITAEALDGGLEPILLADTIEIWVDDASSPVVTGASPLGIRAHTTAPLSAGFVSYGCRVQEGGTTVLSGARKFTVGDEEPAITALAAVPVLFSNTTSRAMDIVFIADHDVYSGPEDPDFLAGAEQAIVEGYFGDPLFLSNQDHLNFWVAINTGSGSDYNPSAGERDSPPFTCADGIDNDGDGLIDSDDGNCRTFCSSFEAPSGWNSSTVFADAGAILHSNQFRDCAPGGQRLFSAQVTRSDYPRLALHETGHRPFGLADEYCCDGGYFQRAQRPNVYTSFTACLLDAPTVGRTAEDCRQWKRASDDKTFWTSDPPSNDLMIDQGDPQMLDIRRIQWMFDQCDQGNC